MGTITSGIGLVSGINTSDIINQLMSIEQQPVTRLQNRVTIIGQQQQAFNDLETSLVTLQGVGWKLQKPSTFQVTTATSSNPSVLSATTTTGAVPGNYQFQVAQVVTSQQSVTQGFADSTSTPVGAGTLTLELGGGQLTSSTNLDQLNGGNGVQRGTFKITDASGQSGLIDISSAVTLDDVAKAINSSLNVSVKATIKDNGLVLQDLSGGAGTLAVSDLGSGKTAANLGIAGSAAAGGTLTGTSINYLSAATSLRTLNDGRGINTASGGNDFSVTTGDGTITNIRLGTVQTVGDVVKAINTQAAANGSKFHAVIGGNGLQLVDDSGGGGSFAVAAGSSTAANDLGILKTAAGGGTINGDAVLTELGTVSLRSLNGGQGLSLGTVHITDRSGNGKDIDLSGAATVQDVLDDINSAGVGVTASLNDSQNGIKLVDTTGQTGNLTVSDVSGTGAASLGIAGTFDDSVAQVSGANLQRQWVSNNTLLSTYNGGKGVSKGSIKITASNGSTSTINLGTANTIGDVINTINAKASGVKASINAHGDGLLITDNAGGTVTVADVDASTARDLNISGSGASGSIDGSFEKTVTVTATDTLSSVATKINNLGFGVSAQVISDGSASAPYRLSLTARNSGLAGQVTFDAGATGLAASNLVNAQDAAVFVGSSAAAKPLLVTSSSNTITGVLPGVSLTLSGVSSSPVQLTIASDPSQISSQLQTFTDTFNSVIDKISALGSYDSTTGQKGLLLGDATLQQVETGLYQPLQSFVANTGNTKYQSFASVGLTIGNDGKLTFDTDTFNAAIGADPTAVQKLFTAFNQKVTVTPQGGTSGTVTTVPFGTQPYGTTTDPVTGATTKVEQDGTGLGFLIANMMTKLIDPVSGTITNELTTLTNQTNDFNDQITQLNTLLADKKSRLQEQFANMETVLAQLKSQGNALSSLTSIAPITASSSSSSSSSS